MKAATVRVRDAHRHNFKGEQIWAVPRAASVRLPRLNGGARIGGAVEVAARLGVWRSSAWTRTGRTAPSPHHTRHCACGPLLRRRLAVRALCTRRIRAAPNPAAQRQSLSAPCRCEPPPARLDDHADLVGVVACAAHWSPRGEQGQQQPWARQHHEISDSALAVESHFLRSMWGWEGLRGFATGAGRDEMARHACGPPTAWVQSRTGSRKGAGAGRQVWGVVRSRSRNASRRQAGWAVAAGR
eukprot:scaffold7963_cov61-Phaeocystis_antarctica.AAC.3